MNKTEFVKAVGKNGGITYKTVKEVLDSIEDVLIDTVSNGEDVVMFNGIRFKSATQGERTCRNPKTGETVVVPEKRVMRMKISQRIKDQISGK